MVTFVPKQLLPAAFWIAGQLNRYFPEEYADEIRGIANASGLPLGLVVSMNILYDILAFDRKHILQLGCTSIVAQTENGTIFHGRNLDYAMGDLLKNVTIIADFTRGQGHDKKIVYSGVTFALSSTLFTGQNDAFSLSLNARYSGPYIYNIFMEFYTRFRTPVGFLLREVLSTSKTYAEAVNHLANRLLFSPSYIIIGGRERGEGAIISRNRIHAVDIRTLNDERWFLVETNFDPWKKDGDKRSMTAEKELKAIGQKALNADTMMKVLRTIPVKNTLTLFSTVMSARFPSLMKNSTFVWE
ncbi:N-acylethanolamine-hydrolyzing acid amidase [Trichostrongylus colubriformis]|uniref:N-acylethanolamine-hydrolyzing acid amidase n=1 Tax=Trichostrongylus colubriformis TaxID=6319 RepID=A0AAN8EPC6_TRICO